MSSLSCVTIDAGVLAVPHVDCRRDDALQYVDMLLDWCKLLRESWVDVHMSKQASKSLFDDGLYPQRNQLSELFNAHGIVEYDVNTVATIANQLLMITPVFEDYYQVEDVLSDNLETHSDVLRLTTHAGLQSELARCITLIAILRRYCHQPVGGHSLILREAPEQIIQVRAQIQVLEHSRNDIPALPRPPEFFEGDVLVCDNFHGLINCLDENAILGGASDDLGIELAVRIALFKNAIEQGNSPVWGGPINLTIGSSFRESCQNVCANIGNCVPSKILRSIVETSNSDNCRDVHPLREGLGGNDPQRMRGSDRAQRRKIDRGLRLHYWECDNNTFELACVAYHDDFSIPI